jgi:membrane protease YdiL (CAAX protease family)
LFLAVYLPAFAIVAALHLTVNRAVPAIIVLTLLTAALLIVLIARRKALSVAAFGFRTGDKRYTAYALALGVPLSATAAILLGHFHEPGPLARLRIAPWLAFIYFGLAAPFQEEVIFRGLLQTSFARDLASLRATTQNAGRIAVVVIAALFAAIHLEVGPLTATCALVLATLAGELRRRSGSLSPAIVRHSLFNIAGIVRALST